MRRMLIILAEAIVSALPRSEKAAAVDSPRSPQSATYLISCLGIAPFLATSPTPLPAGVGDAHGRDSARAVHEHMPTDLVMVCSATDVSTGENIGNVPILIAPTTP
jgi:hypothetical protein